MNMALDRRSPGGPTPHMCNRYALTVSLAEIRRRMKAMGLALAPEPETGNLREYPSIYPDQDAPVILPAGAKKAALAALRWGFPEAVAKGGPITNIRNLNSKWWRDVNREFLHAPEFRCLVPFSAFAEPVRDSTWFAVKGEEVAFFAGIWRPWRGERLAEQPGKKRRAREERDWRLYSFLTTEANDIVRPVHEKAMPVILSSKDDCLEWLAGGEASLRLQRPFPAAKMEILK